VKGQGQLALSPGFVETCARLLVYTEIEQTFGIKTFVSKYWEHSMQSLVFFVAEYFVINTDCHAVVGKGIPYWI